MRGRKRWQAYRSEVNLCAEFLAALEREYTGQWTPYAETEGWDVLLVRIKDGFQIGIQAKLGLNVAVINQCLDEEFVIISG